ncbi:MAG: TonB-dependent receptor, partial [Gammaproteobacteria bacterium]|nr:TonB-dependent receptor [Gammaproteobacteria bacterium]
IEIVKGARSALFGTDAIGGVINIITRRAQDAYFEGSLGSGSFATQSGYLSGGNRGDNSEFGITLNWQTTDGYAPRTDSDIKRGYDNLSANVYASRTIGNTDFSIRHWQTGGKVEYLDFFLTPVDQDFENASTALEVNSQLSDRGTSKLVLSYIKDSITQNQSEDFVESDRVSFDWQYSHAFASHTLTGGMFGIEETASTLSFGSGFTEDTTSRALFLQDQWSRDRHRTFLALRLTDHENFGSRVTWNAEYAFEIHDDWTLNVGFGRAFRAPDATDRYGFGGRPDLDPEVANEVQFGLRYAPDTSHSFDFELYSNDIEDLIEFDLRTFELANIDRAEIRGAQLGYEFRGEGFVLRTEIVRQQAANAVTGSRLLRRAEQSASIAYAQDVGRHRFGLTVIASGDREDFGGVRLAGYVLANVTGLFRINADWTVNGRIENVFDTEYQTAAGFRMQERSGFVELKYHWN